MLFYPFGCALVVLKQKILPTKLMLILKATCKGNNDKTSGYLILRSVAKVKDTVAIAYFVGNPCTGYIFVVLLYGLGLVVKDKPCV